MKFIIITTVKNEEKFIEKTISSVLSQKYKPHHFYIFNDESTDKTGEIIETYSKKYPFIKHITSKNFRPELKDPNARIPAIFNYVYSIADKNYDLLLRIDADTEFPDNYFETIFNAFKGNPKLGIASGRCAHNGKAMPIYRSNVGPTKFYKKECYIDIGERLYELHGNDIMDNVTARMLGWETKTIDICFNHLKPLGQKSNKIKWHYEKGKYKGGVPYYWPYFILTLVRILSEKPIILSSFIQLAGYIQSRYVNKMKLFPQDISNQLISEQRFKIFHPSKIFKPVSKNLLQ